MQQQTPQDLAGVSYRLSAVEQEIKALQAQLGQYVPARENDLQLASIRSTVERIERDVSTASKQLAELNTKMAVQEIASRENQSKLLNRVLWSLVGGGGAIVVGVLIFVLTHALGGGL